MKKHDRKVWRRALHALRLECHPLLPVRVRLLSGPSKHCGHTALALDEAGFNITVFRSVIDCGRPRPMTRLELIDTLVHEWAHALAWPGVPDEFTLDRHDAAWGVAYARCYQTVVED